MILSAGVYAGIVALLGRTKNLITPSLLTRVVSFVAIGSPEIYFLTRWGLIGPVMIVERRFGWNALRRSRKLVKGAWWRTLGIVVAATVIANAPEYALGFIWRYVPLVGSILGSATHAVSTCYGMVVSVIYYFDRRCRTEDFDLRLLAQQVRDATPSAMAPAPDSPALA